MSRYHIPSIKCSSHYKHLLNLNYKLPVLQKKLKICWKIRNLLCRDIWLRERKLELFILGNSKLEANKIQTRVTCNRIKDNANSNNPLWFYFFNCPGCLNMMNMVTVFHALVEFHSMFISTCYFSGQRR